MSKGKMYGAGLFLFILGSAGIAQAVTDDGPFLVSAILFSVGIGLILGSYVKK